MSLSSGNLSCLLNISLAGPEPTNVVNMPTFCCCPRKARGKVKHTCKAIPHLHPCSCAVLLRSGGGEEETIREAQATHHLPVPFLGSNPHRCVQCTHHGAGNGFLWFLRAQLFHGIVVLLLFFSHEDVLTSKVKEGRREGAITTGSQVFWLWNPRFKIEN